MEKDYRIVKTKEEKAAEKELKKLEKLKRKEKSLNKGNENPDIQKNDKKEIKQNNSQKPKVTSEIKSNQPQINDKDKTKKTNQSESKDLKLRSTDRISFSDEPKHEKIKSTTSVISRIEISDKPIWYNHVFIPNREMPFIDSFKKPIKEIIPEYFIDLGKKIDSLEITCSTKMCQEFLSSLKRFISTLEVKSGESFENVFSNQLNLIISFLKQCRQIPTIIESVVDYFKSVLFTFRQCNNEEQKRTQMSGHIDDFIEDRLKLAKKYIIEDIFDDNPQYLQRDAILVLDTQIDSNLISLILNKIDSSKTTNVIYCVDTGIKNVEISHKSIIQIQIGDVPKVLTQSKSFLVLLEASCVYQNGSVKCMAGSAFLAYTANHYANVHVVVVTETCKFSTSDPSLETPEVFMRSASHDSKDKSVKSFFVVSDIVTSDYITVLHHDLGSTSPSSVPCLTNMKQPV